MPHKVKVSGSRPLRKGSKKGSRKGSKKNSRNSKKHNGLDFTSILNEGQLAQNNQQNMQMPGMNMPGMNMPGMAMPGMAMPGMGMPGMQGMDMGMGMQGMDMSNQMFMGQDSDPLHLQNLVPQKNMPNINNYGLSYDQLSNGAQDNSLANRFNGRGMQQTQAQPQTAIQSHSQVEQPVQSNVSTQMQAINKKYYRL
jgi:hypothetical protein